MFICFHKSLISLRFHTWCLRERVDFWMGPRPRTTTRDPVLSTVSKNAASSCHKLDYKNVGACSYRAFGSFWIHFTSSTAIFRSHSCYSIGMIFWCTVQQKIAIFLSLCVWMWLNCGEVYRISRIYFYWFSILVNSQTFYFENPHFSSVVALGPAWYGVRLRTDTPETRAREFARLVVFAMTRNFHHKCWCVANRRNVWSVSDRFRFLKGVKCFSNTPLPVVPVSTRGSWGDFIYVFFSSKTPWAYFWFFSFEIGLLLGHFLSFFSLTTKCGCVFENFHL